MSDKTWNEDQIRNAVMTYSEGCTPGKVEFLDAAFGIDAQCEMVVELTVTITMDAYGDDGKIDPDDVKCEIESLIDSDLCHRIGGIEGVDARVRLA